MTFNLFIYVLTYSFLICLLTVSLLSSYWSRWFKLMIVLMVPIAIVSAHHTWRQAQGWPSQTDVPKQFLLNGAIVEEPDTDNNIEGAIFLWLTDLHQHQIEQEPRAYRIAYDEKLHLNIQQALRKMRDGQLQLGEVNTVANDSGKSNPNKTLGELKKMVIEFRDLPDPALPEK